MRKKAGKDEWKEKWRRRWRNREQSRAQHTELTPRIYKHYYYYYYSKTHSMFAMETLFNWGSLPPHCRVITHITLTFSINLLGCSWQYAWHLLFFFVSLPCLTHWFPCVRVYMCRYIILMLIKEQIKDWLICQIDRKIC